jgi:hypothetical protein
MSRDSITSRILNLIEREVEGILLIKPKMGNEQNLIRTNPTNLVIPPIRLQMRERNQIFLFKNPIDPPPRIVVISDSLRLRRDRMLRVEVVVVVVVVVI